MRGYTKCKCPHAKSKLIYNEMENTYDYPCYGSRFDINGKVIKGPSNKNIEIKKKKIKNKVMNYLVFYNI